MVDKFQNILRTLITTKGGVIFFGVFKMDEITEKWTVILVANWASNRNETFVYLRNLILKELTEEESSTIARIGIFPEDEHLIDLLLNYKTGSRIQGQQVNGNLIHDGYVLASNRDVEPRVVPLA